MSVMEDGEINKVFPVSAPGTGEQETRYLETRLASTAGAAGATQQALQQNVLGAGNVGVHPLQRVKLTFESNIQTEIRYVLDQLVLQSNQGPASISFKNEYAFLTEYLLNLLESDQTSLDMKVDIILIIRNAIQSIENCQILSFNSRLRDFIIKVLISKPNTLFEKEQFHELFKFCLDIVENISSYLSPINKDDPILRQLLEIFRSSENKYILITILRSISRFLYNSSESTNDASVLIDDAFLNKTVNFLLLSVNHSTIDDEIILTSLDFLIQYLSIKEQNMKLLTQDPNRSAVLSQILPRLLVHNQRFRTEFDQTEFLKLYKRVKEPLNTEMLTLDTESPLIKQLNAMTEPERAHAWMRCCFRPNVQSSLTQIDLWRSYESHFDNASLLSAVVFIRNVHTAFPQSNAKVITSTEGEKKFIIQGIEPRREPVSIEEGKIAALENTVDTNATEKTLNQAEQVQPELFHYGLNASLSLNEINMSAIALMRQMSSSVAGANLLRTQKNQLLERSIQVPQLVSPVMEILDSL